jgi:rRNA-processing protein EBP2
MGPKSILKKALATEKGVDFKKLKEKKKHKETMKRKKLAALPPPKNRQEEDEDDQWEEAEEDEEERVHSAHEQAELNGKGVCLITPSQVFSPNTREQIDIEALNDSDTSDSSVDMEKKIVRPPKPKFVQLTEPAILQNVAEETDEDEDEEDIPMSDLDDLADSDKEDLIPHTRLTINNATALFACLNRIAIPKDSSVPFANHQVVVSSSVTAEGIPDISDDLQREMALLGQSLEAARKGRALLRSEKVSFSRPTDYFAEMVKDDGHMTKVKEKLVEEASAKKASAEAKKLRELKKFGKQVQVAKLQERQKAKKDTLEKITELKRSTHTWQPPNLRGPVPLTINTERKSSGGEIGANEADLFDVAVDDEMKSFKRQKTGSSASSSKSRDANRAPNAKRQQRNEKFGFGGKKRHSKSGDAVSSGDVGAYSSRGLRDSGKSKVSKSSRLGKSRRKVQSRR